MKRNHGDVDHIHIDDGIEESPREYAKLSSVFGGVLILVLFLAWARGFELQRFIGDFMAVFFITFAAFKFVNLDEFVSTYRDYDVLAKKFRVWAFALPFIEGVLGVAYLLYHDYTPLNLIVMTLTGLAAYGAWQELRNQSNIMSAFLGTVIKLPLSKVSLIENLSMFLMATIMIVL
ncbi:MAG: hypothetical protein U5K77_02310 [Candidatus Saccharibacteria bacterium]|nr:hypothetical protein [Candidatus Saccharibacteria bacterium]